MTQSLSSDGENLLQEVTSILSGESSTEEGETIERLLSAVLRYAYQRGCWATYEDGELLIYQQIPDYHIAMWSVSLGGPSSK